MKVIVCGAGKVGSEIATYLSAEGNDVVVIDHDLGRIQKLSDSLDVQTIYGFASHPPILEQAGADEVDLIIAVTLSDEINMIACQIAYSLFNVKMKIARIRNQNYLNPKWEHLYTHNHMPIDVRISPELEVAQNIINRLHMPGAIDTIPIKDGVVKMALVRIDKDTRIKDKRIYNINNNLKALNSKIFAIIRQNKILIPQITDRIEVGDLVYYIGEAKHSEKIMQEFGCHQQEARNIIIVGGGTIGSFLAKTLEDDENDIDVGVIEVNKGQAQILAEKLNDAIVVNGSALEEEILDEIGAKKAQTIIAVSNDDEVNILSCLLSKTMGCKKAISLINNTSYAPLISSIGIDVVVNPREVTISTILRYIRKGNIKEVYSLYNSTAEVLETQIKENSLINGKKICQIQTPEDVEFLAIIRDNQVMIIDEKDETAIKAGDYLIVLSMSSSVKKIDKLFSLVENYF